MILPVTKDIRKLQECRIDGGGELDGAQFFLDFNDCFTLVANLVGPQGWGEGENDNKYV